MATAKKSSRSGSSRSGSSRTGKGKTSASRAGAGFWQGFFQVITLTFFGRVFLAVLVAAILIGVNLLFTRDRFDWFYTVCAIEIIAFVAIGWLRLLLRPEND